MHKFHFIKEMFFATAELSNRFVPHFLEYEETLQSVAGDDGNCKSQYKSDI